MKRKHFIISVMAVLFLFMVVNSLAHTPYMEPQVVRRWGKTVEGEDFSFEHPFIIPSGTIMAAKAIYAYLSYGDVDVYQYTLEEGESYLFPSIATAMPPACRVYRTVYPRTAFIGPGLPDPDPSENYPFEIPEGCGIVSSHPTKVPLSEERPVLKLTDNPDVNISWFYFSDPENDFAICHLEVPGTYYIVFWNPTKLPCDYTANIGVTEPEISDEDRRQQEIINTLYSDQKVLRFPCVEMEGPSPFDE
jgi:hypothetical protein